MLGVQFDGDICYNLEVIIRPGYFHMLGGPINGLEPA